MWAGHLGRTSALMTNHNRNFQGPRLEAYKFFTRRAKAKLFFFFSSSSCGWHDLKFIPVLLESLLQWINRSVNHVPDKTQLQTGFSIRSDSHGFRRGIRGWRAGHISCRVSFFTVTISTSMLQIVNAMYSLIRTSCQKGHPWGDAIRLLLVVVSRHMLFTCTYTTSSHSL